MKKTKSWNRLLLLLSVTLMALSCKETPEPTPPVDPTTPIEPFTIELVSSTPTNFEVSVKYNASMEEHAYYIGILPEGTATTSYNTVVEYAANKGSVLGTVDNKYIFSGNATTNLADNWEVTNKTTYRVVAFAIDADGELLTNVAYSDVLVDSGLPDSGTPYISTVTTTYSDIVVDVQMNGYEGNYFFAACPTSDFEDIFKGDPNTFAEAYIYTEINDYGTDLSVVDDTYVFNSSATINTYGSWILTAEGSYTIAIFGIDNSGEILTDVSWKSATLSPLPEGSVAVEVESTDRENIYLNTTPTTEIEKYMVAATPSDVFTQNFKDNANELATSVIFNVIGKGIDLGTVDNAYIFSGDANVAIGEQWNIRSDKEYTVITFGIDGDGRQSSQATIVEATTIAYDPTLGTIDGIAISDITYMDATATVTTSSFSGIYFLAPFPTTEYKELFQSDPEALAIALGTEFYDKVDMSTADDRYTFNANATVQLSSGWDFAHGVEYIVIAFGVSPDGGVLSAPAVSDPFTTDNYPDLTFTIDVVDKTETSARVKFTPSITDISYYCDMVSKADYDHLTDYEIYESFVAKNGSWYDWYLVSGEYERTRTDLRAGTEYIALAYGHSDAIGIGTTVTRHYFTTEGTYVPPLEIPTEVTIPTNDFGAIAAFNPTTNTIDYKLTPIDKEMTYLTGIMAEELWDSYSSDSERVIKHLNEVAESGAGFGHDYERSLYVFSENGDKNSTQYSLSPSTKYVLFVYGINITTGELTSKLTYTTMTTSAATTGAPKYYSSAQITASNYEKQYRAKQEATPAPQVVEHQTQLPIAKDLELAKYFRNRAVNSISIDGSTLAPAELRK